MEKLANSLESFIKSALGLENGIENLGDALLESFLPQLIATAILILIMKRYVWGSVSQMLEERKLHVENEITGAEELKKSAVEHEVEIKVTLENSKIKATEIIEEAKLKASNEGASILEKAKEDAKAKVERAKEEIENEKIKARQDLKEEFAEVAIQVASKIIEKEIDKDKHTKIIEESLKGLGE